MRKLPGSKVWTRATLEKDTDMARFPYHERNVVELGKLIARAAVDEKYRKFLQGNAAAELADIGLPTQTTKLIEFKVVDSSQHPSATVLPFRLNQAKLDARNPDYLSALSKVFALN